MKKKNLFELLALKETESSNKYIQKLKPLKEEKIKILNILEQLNALKETKNLSKDLSGWELKSASNIEKKIFDQISLAENKKDGLIISIAGLFIALIVGYLALLFNF